MEIGPKETYPLQRNMLRTAARNLLDWLAPSAVPFLPNRPTNRIRHWQARRHYLQYLNRTLGYHRTDIDIGPSEPFELLLKTSALREEDAHVKSNADLYFAGAYAKLLEFFQILEENCQFRKF